MMETKENSQMFAVSNAAIQVSAMLLYQYFAFAWGMYFVMGMIVILGTMQTLSGAYLIGTPASTVERKESVQSDSSQIIVGLIYCLSSYQIYLMGFEFFAGFALAQSVFYTLIVIYKRAKS
jgi:asparagine N-glycosylation enzyme membrane subunit Stt3